MKVNNIVQYVKQTVSNKSVITELALKVIHAFAICKIINLEVIRN